MPPAMAMTASSQLLEQLPASPDLPLVVDEPEDRGEGHATHQADELAIGSNADARHA